jgi:hypothetical protein
MRLILNEDCSENPVTSAIMDGIHARKLGKDLGQILKNPLIANDPNILNEVRNRNECS